MNKRPGRYPNLVVYDRGEEQGPRWGVFVGAGMLKEDVARFFKKDDAIAFAAIFAKFPEAPYLPVREAIEAEAQAELRSRVAREETRVAALLNLIDPSAGVQADLPQSWIDLMRRHDAAEQAKGAAVEAGRWRKEPGTYRLEDGSVEVIVDLPESLSFLQDEYPDEVAEVQRMATEAERERLRPSIDAVVAVYNGIGGPPASDSALLEGVATLLDGVDDATDELFRQAGKERAPGSRDIQIGLRRIAALLTP